MMLAASPPLTQTSQLPFFRFPEHRFAEIKMLAPHHVLIVQAQFGARHWPVIIIVAAFFLIPGMPVAAPLSSITAAASTQRCFGICDPQSCPTRSCRLLSKQTNFLVYCEQMGDDLCANGLQAVAVVRVLQYFASPLRIAPCRLKVRLGHSMTPAYVRVSPESGNRWGDL